MARSFRASMTRRNVRYLLVACLAHVLLVTTAFAGLRDEVERMIRTAPLKKLNQETLQARYALTLM